MNPEHSTYKSKGGASRLGNALRYSGRGLGAAFQHEAAFRQELVAVALLTPVGIWLGRSWSEVALLLGALCLVLVVELLNSAIEALADAISVDSHPLLGRAKDLGSAAVFLSILLAICVWGGTIISHM